VNFLNIQVTVSYSRRTLLPLVNCQQGRQVGKHAAVCLGRWVGRISSTIQMIGLTSLDQMFNISSSVTWFGLCWFILAPKYGLTIFSLLLRHLLHCRFYYQVFNNLPFFVNTAGNYSCNFDCILIQ